jgi:transposase
LDTRLIQARPYDPETKGVVERANGYLGTSFLPGRSFTSPADFNTQLTDWLAAVANVRRHATTRLIPVEALASDRVAMPTLPPVAPATGTTVSTRLGRDYYVTIASSAYSVHPEVIGRMITVNASLDRIRAHCGDRMVADHERLWGAHGLASDPAHVAAASILRQQYLHRRTGTEDHLQVDVEVADLSAYDAVFGTGEVA